LATLPDTYATTGASKKRCFEQMRPIRQSAGRSKATAGPEERPTAVPDDRVSLEQRSDGAVIVRVHSAGTGPDRLPDAVFAFRCGDPQYAYWLERLAGQQAGCSAVKNSAVKSSSAGHD